jgi:hypothetical protein
MRVPKTSSDAARALRIAAAALALAGVALLVITTVATVKEIRVGSATDPVLAGGTAGLSGWDRHGPALLLLAALALPLGAGALRGARPAALALAVTGLAVLLIAVAGDLPDLHDVGQVGFQYADSAAGAGPGWYTETAAGVALLVSGVLLVLLGAGSAGIHERATPALGPASEAASGR